MAALDANAVALSLQNTLSQEATIRKQGKDENYRRLQFILLAKFI